MMTPTTTIPAIRIVANSATRQSNRLLFARAYATQTGLGTTATPKSKRRSVTPFNDTGFVPWSELSAAEKAARATQQSYNFGIIAVGLVFTVRAICHCYLHEISNANQLIIRAQGFVTYYLWTDVFSPESKTRQFNRAVDRIKKDHRCLELLGDANKISAHGDETFNKWRRARPIT